jgi:hypothetical protein
MTRRLARIAFFLSVGIAGGFVGAPPVHADGAGRDLEFGLFVDMLGNAAGAAEKTADQAEPFQFDIIGMPVSIGSRDPDSAVPGLTVGIDGSYKLPIEGAFSVIATGSLQKTRYLEDEFWGSDRAAGSATISRENDGWRMTLEPGFVYHLRASEMIERRYFIDGRASKDILPGLAFSTSTGFTRRHAPLAIENNADLGRAQLGLIYHFGESARLNLSYDMTRKWADQPQDSHGRSGPSVGVSFAMFDFLEIGTRYQYCENIEYDLNGTDLKAVVEEVHSVGMNASWHDPDADFLTLTADYRFEQTRSDVMGHAGQSHDGMITLGLRF